VAADFWPLVLVRGSFVAAMLSATGALMFRVRFGTPPGLRPLITASLGTALTAGALWLGLTAAGFADADSVAAALAAVPAVLAGTTFGRALAMQLAALAAAAALQRRDRAGPALALAALAAGLQATHLHGWAMAGTTGLITLLGLLHVLAAAFWLGGLAPLFLLLRAVPPAAAATAVRGFSRLGIVCVALLAASAYGQGAVLIGGLPDLAASAYGRTVAAKLALFALLLSLAARHRFRLTPALTGDASVSAGRALAHSVLAETGIGLLAVFAAAVLSYLPPGFAAPVANALARLP
jgi:putative copper resistance protein D